MDYVVTAPAVGPFTAANGSYRPARPYPVYVHEPDPEPARTAQVPAETVLLMGSYGDPVRTWRGDPDLASTVARVGYSTRTPATVDPLHPDQVTWVARELRARWDRTPAGTLKTDNRDPPAAREIVLTLARRWGVILDEGAWHAATLEVTRALTALAQYMADRDWDWDDYELHFRYFPTGADDD